MPKLTRAELDRLGGKKKPVETVPPKEPAPVPKMSFDKLESTVDRLTEQVALATQAFTSAAPQPIPEHKAKKLEAIIHRDADGKMTRVEINVT